MLFILKFLIDLHAKRCILLVVQSYGYRAYLLTKRLMLQLKQRPRKRFLNVYYHTLTVASILDNTFVIYDKENRIWLSTTSSML